jgi:hypothetical protein
MVNTLDSITELSAQLTVFGFARMPELAAPHLDGITRAFDQAVGISPGSRPTTRVTRFDVLDVLPGLAAVAGGGDVLALREAFFGRSSQVVASDMNLLVGDSYWHSDGFYSTPFLRFVLYLEPLTAASGALRFLPGSHKEGNGWVGDPTRHVIKHDADLGRAGTDVPGVVCESRPGDVIVFDTNILHSAWCGGFRRQLAFNVVGNPRTDAERRDSSRYLLNRYVSGSVPLA